MCCCLGNPNNHQFLGNNTNFSTSPFPSPCTCTLGTGRSTDGCFHLWVGEKDGSILQRIIDNSRQILCYCTEECECFLLFSWVQNVAVTQTGGEESRKIKVQVTAPLRAVACDGPWPEGERWGIRGTAFPCPRTLVLDRHSGLQHIRHDVAGQRWQTILIKMLCCSTVSVVRGSQSTW